MKRKLFLALLFVVALAFLPRVAYSDPSPDHPVSASSSTEAGPLESFKAVGQSGVSLLGDIGSSFLVVALLLSPECLGGLICLIVPLALIGLWTVSSFGRILGLFRFRDGARSLLRE